MKEAWSNAESIESYDGISGDLEKVGRQQSRACIEKEFVFYRDQNGNYWYRVEFRKGNTRLSEYEYIFGKKPKKRRN